MAHYRTATLSDCIKLAPNLREQDKEELKLASGDEPLEALIYSLNASEECNAIIDDNDNIVGLFGVAPVDELTGSPWLLGAEGIKDIKQEFLEGCSSWITEVQERHPILLNYVHKDNTVAIRWLRWLGFSFLRLVDDFGKGKAPFYEFIRTKQDV